MALSLMLKQRNLFLRSLCILVLAFTLSQASCQQKKAITNAAPLEKSSPYILKAYKEPVGGNEYWFFSIENNSSQTLTLYHPYEILLIPEGKERPVSIRDCPCNAPCARRPETMSLEAGQTHRVGWDRMQTTCAPVENNSELNTIRSYVQKGKYQIVWLLQFPDSADHTRLSHEFWLD